jgi:hypothetical protein
MTEIHESRPTHAVTGTMSGKCASKRGFPGYEIIRCPQRLSSCTVFVEFELLPEGRITISGYAKVVARLMSLATY